MLTYKPKSTVPCVRYFYLAANGGRQAEIIQVINSCSDVVLVPMREEDMELTTFFERDLTPLEKVFYNGSETWKVFTCWEELQQDHVYFGLKEGILDILLTLRYQFSMEEDMAASA